MHFSDIPRAVVVALAFALLPCPVIAQAEADPDEPATDAEPAPASPAASPAPAVTPPPSTATDPAPGDPGTPGAVEVTPPPEQGPEAPADAALSWTALGGRLPTGDTLVAASFGFAGLPSVSIHYALTDAVSLGAVGGFDYGRYTPDRAFDAGGHVAASIKVGIPVDEDLRLGIRGDFGVLFPASPGVGLTIDLSANLVAPVAEGVYAGASIEVPLTVNIFDGGTSLGWPLLFGGLVEYRILAPLAVFAEAKGGPAFLAPGGVVFAMKLAGGIAYRL